ncbi:fasciclin domain-containing protein [Rhodophyticola sp. CCM32]|uniref:fasciclin domain-containing protein n=1 Tax=Rhodophyticola sp. CCM32 TaxID=2916397 RepID=UPI00107FB5F8|nr:fasciclin domain-containing protein [Rhodophyticola sp. CCM32]QBY02450.1 fasciclin domain-containing protein [Rhodophyticola sp. CCM32]
MLRRTLLALATSGLLAGPAFADGHSMDIVDTAVNAGSFNTLVAAVQAAGLEDTLRGDGPFTVFAPTDEAFAALPEGTVENLLLEENRDQLVAILTYHVAPDSYPAAAILGQDGRIPTVQGDDLAADGTGDGVTLNGSVNVTSADIMASNGVIHVIDAVLLPH